MISKHLVKYILLAAMRDKLLMTLVLMTVLSALMAIFMGSAAVTEAGNFTIVFASGGLRILGVVGLVLFCSFYVRRSFETKEVEFLLSRPISRFSFLLSHAAAFSILATAIALLMSGIIFYLGRTNLSGVALWGASLASEYVIIAVVSLFFAMVLTSAAGSALATLGFYALCRMMGTVLAIVATSPELLTRLLGSVMKVVSVIVPRFDLMGRTSWLVYGVDKSTDTIFLPTTSPFLIEFVQNIGMSGFILLQTILFVALLIAAASYDFYRREF